MMTQKGKRVKGNGMGGYAGGRQRGAAKLAFSLSDVMCFAAGLIALPPHYLQVALKTSVQNGCAGRLYTSFAVQTSTSCLTGRWC
jgi:hypothetical protein